ncbi:MAG: zinc ribbon domain-containing protein [Methanomicrobiales archaeon]|nr:zinc ribbon domain-containing protein [Methanomicrobiales archaeon]
MEPPHNPICQSCGIPLRRDEDFGTELDGSKSKEYCFHCFQMGNGSR